MKMQSKRSNRLAYALPLAAALLLPGTAFAATNLPQSDARTCPKSSRKTRWKAACRTMRAAARR